MRRLPIRLRLTLAFTAVMAIVLTASGLFLYFRLANNLDHGIAESLRTRSRDISALVQQSDTGLKDAAHRRNGQGPADGGFAQILDRSGRVFDGTAGLQRRPLLSPVQLRRAQFGPATLDLAAGAKVRWPARLLATPVHAQGRHLVVVVGASLADRNQALDNLTTLLMIGGPATLLLAALAAYGFASATLRPVEAGIARERAFIAEASHELRTPLTTLKMELELMARDRPTGAAHHEALQAAIADADRLGRLSQDLLALARADRGQRPLVPETVEVSGLLQKVARRYPEADVRVAARASAESEVHADPVRLEQALTNMVDNALRHGEPPVRLSAEERHGSLELHVTDRGPGLPPAFMHRSFERFARADAAHTTEGTGLGLAIVRTIAEAHGGSAEVANRPGGGADVWITLPLQRTREATAVPSERLPAPARAV